MDPNNVPDKSIFKEASIMKTNPQIQCVQHTFHYQDKPIRMLQEGRETWFVAADICTALGLPQVSRAVRRVSPYSTKLVKVSLLQQPNRSVAMNVVDCIGLEEMMQQGTKQAADPFQRWLEREVIPVELLCDEDPLAAAGLKGNVPIETKTLDFAEVPSATPEATTAADPAEAEQPRFSRSDLILLALDAEDECDALKKKIAALEPKAAAYDRLAAGKDSYSLGETAKLLGIPLQGRNNLIKFLRRDGILMEGNIAKQRYIDSGHFSVVQQDYFAQDGSPRVRPVTRVYASGVEFIRNRMDNYIRRQLATPGGF
jgi:phage antirepressor YoqD-like protein